MVVKQILFIGLSSVGDVVMTSPVMQSLNSLFPEAVFDVVGDKRSENIYQHMPFVRNFFFKDKDKFMRGTPALISQLWKTKYDLIVDLRTDGLAYLLRGKKRYTKWFKKSYGEHAVEDLIGVIYRLHGGSPIPHTKLWLADEHREYAKEKCAVFPKGRLLSLSVGAEDKLFKSWTEDKFIQLCNEYKNKFVGLVFLGNDAERDRTNRVIDKIELPYIDTLGNNLLEAAALLEKTDLYIGPDSGLGHIASAMNTSTISFFSVVSPSRYRPWGKKAQFIIGENKDARTIPVKAVSDLVRKAIV